jgi:hypothetical protein
MNDIKEIVLDFNKQKWRTSDIQKNERMSADNEYDGRRTVGNAVMSYYVYSNKTKKEYEGIFTKQTRLPRTFI